jgi:hypothetical protein
VATLAARAAGGVIHGNQSLILGQPTWLSLVDRIKVAPPPVRGVGSSVPTVPGASADMAVWDQLLSRDAVWRPLRLDGT